MQHWPSLHLPPIFAIRNFVPERISQLQGLPPTNSLRTENGCVLKWPSWSGKFSLQPVSGYVLSMCFGGWTGQSKPSHNKTDRNSLQRPRSLFSTACTAAPAASSCWTTASWPFCAARCKDVSPEGSGRCWFDRSFCLDPFEFDLFQTSDDTTFGLSSASNYIETLYSWLTG